MTKISHTAKGIEKIEMPSPWPIGNVNVYLIRGERLTLVDCGMNEASAWHHFNEELRKLGLKFTDIEQIVLTHHHCDHVGFLDFILREHPIPVYAHANCAPYLSQDQAFIARGNAFFKQFYKEFGLPDRWIRMLADEKDWHEGLTNPVEFASFLEEGMAVPGLPDWQVIETKGHAQSHISLYRTTDQVLICGDHVIKHSPAGIFLEPPLVAGTERAKPLMQYIENVAKCMDIPVSTALSGHGEPIEELKPHLEGTLRKIDRRTQKIKNMLLGDWKSGLAIIQELYPDKYTLGLELFTSDLVSLLDVLMARGEVETDVRNGVIHYRAFR
ncbi:MAG: MBL fold metallo-hydrolase [Bacillus sp. (in: firmicutes)]